MAALPAGGAMAAVQATVAEVEPFAGGDRCGRTARTRSSSPARPLMLIG